MQKVVLGALGVLLGHYLLQQHRQSARQRLVSPRNERVVIIGASSGIGRECALQYAKRGATLILFARREKLLQQLQQECQDAGSPSVNMVVGDVTVEEDLEKLSKSTRGVDTVIYCAGMISVRPFLDNKQDRLMDALQKITQTNYFSAVLTARLFLPLLMESSASPNLIIISSLAGKVGAPTRSLYAGAKHAVQGFFDSLRVEVAPLNVHVGLVCPGTVDTALRQSAVDLNSEGHQEEIAGSKKNKLSPATVAARIICASDAREREVYLPVLMCYGAVFGNVFAKPIVDWFAAKKYKV
ncbi:NAD(P)-binding protein [Backusella circina FSU 941]|nr:NAD(P)-binding protein [Backusella circina FSU 941]